MTDFADQAVILPIVFTIGGVLAFQWWRGAIAWFLAISGTFATMVVLKIGFMACSSGPIHTPSGHVAAAAVVTGGLAMLLLHWRPTVLSMATMAAIVVGVSRLVLHAHSLSEVVVGAMVGLIGATVLLWTAGPVPENLKVGRIFAIVAIIAALMHGFHFPAEAHIHSLARHARVILGC